MRWAYAAAGERDLAKEAAVAVLVQAEDKMMEETCYGRRTGFAVHGKRK